MQLCTENGTTLFAICPGFCIGHYQSHYRFVYQQIDKMNELNGDIEAHNENPRHQKFASILQRKHVIINTIFGGFLCV